MKKKAKKMKINYVRFITSLIILALIIFGIIQLIGAITNKENAKQASANTTEENTISNETNTTANEIPNQEVSTKPTRESKATPLAAGEKSKNSLPVLMYHYFYDASQGQKGSNSNWLEISKFEEQLKYLKENDYYFPNWQEVADFVDGKVDLPKKSIVLTMDDGHKSLYNLAIPLLDKYDIPATAFIITSKFDTANIEKYKNSTIDFESHSHNMHRAGGKIGHGGIFTALSIEEGVADLTQSIEKIGGNSGALAYPYGDFTESTKKATKQAGFKVAFTTQYGKVKPGMDKYELPRVRIYQDITLGSFKGSI